MNNIQNNEKHIGSRSLNNIIIGMLLLFYTFFIIKAIVFKFPLSYFYDVFMNWDRSLALQGLDAANFVPFKTINMYIAYYPKYNGFANLYGNILVFIPYGILYGLYHTKKRNILMFLSATLIFIVGMESFQMMTNCGIFDVDDIMLNVAGAMGGYIIYKIGFTFYKIVVGEGSRIEP